jgi:hypothetical protein
MFPLHLQALTSLKKYPLPLSSGQEAKILDHIGMHPLPSCHGSSSNYSIKNNSELRTFGASIKNYFWR